MSTRPSGMSPRNRRRLEADLNAALIPKELEKWERRLGFIAAFLIVAVLVAVLELNKTGLHIKVPAPTKHNPHHTRMADVVPQFWAGIGLSIGMLFATRYEKRQALAVAMALAGLDLSFILYIYALPFIIGGVWLMLRASKRTRQLVARGEGPAARRAAERSKSSGKQATGPAASKRYTPPTSKKGAGGGSRSVGVGRGGMIRGDLPTRREAEDEEPGGLLGKFAGKKREPAADEE